MAATAYAVATEHFASAEVLLAVGAAMERRGSVLVLRRALKHTAVSVDRTATGEAAGWLATLAPDRRLGGCRHEEAIGRAFE